jgi:hypothetical protein
MRGLTVVEIDRAFRLVAHAGGRRDDHVDVLDVQPRAGVLEASASWLRE